MVGEGRVENLVRKAALAKWETRAQLPATVAALPGTS